VSIRGLKWPGALVALALLLSLTFAPAASAQLLQGSIDGNVTDSSQAAIIGAEVTITNELTNAVRTTSTNEIGSFTFPTVNTGSYTVSVSSEGFQTYQQTSVGVSINNVTRVDIALEIGQITETVTVAASAATLQTSRADVQQNVNEKALKDLPVPLGRNYQMLFVTLPGFSPPTNAHSIPTNPSRSVSFSVNGTSRSNNNTRIDGASVTNIWVPHVSGYLPALESIESVSATTSSMDAEQGLAGGAAINVQIKSGTNDVHGSAFEYHVNQHLKAYPWNDPRNSPQGKLIDNQFGGTIGGPIKKDKLFYFVSYEGRREREFRFRLADVPTAAMRAGDLSVSPTPIYDPFSGNPATGEGRTPFANNQIPTSRIDPGSQAFMDTGDWGLPNRPGGGDFNADQNFGNSAGTKFDRDILDSKVNWNATDKFTAFVRFSFLDFRTTNPTVFGAAGGQNMHRTNSNPGVGFGNSYSGTASATYVFSPTFIVDGYFGYTLVDTNIEQQRLDENLGWTVWGVPGLQSNRKIDGGWPRVFIDGFDRVGTRNNFQPYFRSDPQWQWVVNANWTKGSHNIRFGADLYLQHLDHNQPENPGAFGGASGGFRFRDGATQLQGGPGGNDMNSMGSFLLGTPEVAGKIWQFDENGYTTRTSFYSFYLQDRWQVNQKLTLSMGLRYELFPIPGRADRGLERFDFDNGNMWACGVGSIPHDCGYEKGVNASPKPRLGLAYRIDDNTVLRAGYGITNDPFNWARPLRTNYPILLTQVLNAPSSLGFGTTLREGLPVIPDPDLGDGILDLDPTAVATSMDNTNTTRGYIQSWNLTLERRFAGWIGSLGYVATRSNNQLVRLDQNWAPIDGGTPGRVLNQKFGRTVSTYTHGSLGTAKYDALQAKLDHRFSAGYQIGMGFTWSHGRGYTDEDSGDSPKRIGIPWLYRNNYGRLDEDTGLNFQLTAMMELPFGAGKRFAQSGAAAKILGGWQVNTLVSRYRGRPFTVTDSGSTLNAPGSSQFADCLSKPTKLGETGAGSRYYDPSAFGRVPGSERRFGTCGINNLTAPALFNMDAGIFRKFQVNERVSIQFRAEMFNLSNTPHFREPRTGVNSSNFMRVDRIRNTGREGIDERTTRLGLRIGW